MNESSSDFISGAQLVSAMIVWAGGVLVLGILLWQLSDIFRLGVSFWRAQTLALLYACWKLLDQMAAAIAKKVS